MAIIHADNSNFKSEVLDSKGTVLVDFFEKVADKHPDVKVVKVDVDQANALASSYGVMGVPTILVFKNGEIVNKAVGYRNEAGLEAMIN